MIRDQQAWVALQNDRNLTSHVYDEETAKVIFERIENQHLALFDEVLAYMKEAKHPRRAEYSRRGRSVLPRTDIRSLTQG